MESEGGSRSNVGILFVHGIGSQPSGGTLTTFGDPLVVWLRRWLSKGNDGTNAVELSSTVLSGGAEPATTELSVTGPDGKPRRWTLRESWWAESFTGVGSRPVAAWVVGLVPVLTVAHFGTIFARAWSAQRRLRRLPNLVVATTLFIVGVLVVTPVLSLAAVILYVLSALPGTSWRKAVGRALVAVTSSLGDSYALVASPLRFDAMVTKVRADLDQLADRCHAVVVVAHSQGAVLAHEAVTRAAEPPSLLITVGSGIGKLRLARFVRETTLGRVLATASWAGLVASIAAAAGWSGLFSGTDEDAFVYGGGSLFGFAALVFVAVAFVSAFVAAREHDVLAVQPPAGVRWIDCWATMDPVPNGSALPPMTGEQSDEPRAVEVANRFLPFADHSGYASNLDEVVSVVAIEAGALAGQDLLAVQTGDPAQVDRARGAHRFRAIVNAGMIAAGVALFVVVVARNWTRLDDFGVALPSWLTTALGPVRKALESVPGLEGDDNTIAGLSAAIVAGIAWLALSEALWSAWDRRQVARFFSRADADLGGPLFGTLLAWLAASTFFAFTVGREVLADLRSSIAIAFSDRAFLLLVRSAGALMGAALVIALLRERSKLDQEGHDDSAWGRALIRGASQAVPYVLLLLLPFLYTVGATDPEVAVQTEWQADTFLGIISGAVVGAFAWLVDWAVVSRLRRGLLKSMTTLATPIAGGLARPSALPESP